MTAKHRAYEVVRSSARVRPIRTLYRTLAHRGRLPIKTFEGMPVDPVFKVRIDRETQFTYRGADSDNVASSLFWANLSRWEPETWREFIPRARRARGFLDIGSFTGSFTLVACAVNPTIKCIAFEPVPHVHQRLVENIAINGWERRARTVNAAVSDVTGPARFYLPSKEFPDTGFLEQSRRPPGDQQGNWVTVQATTVAAAVPADMPIDLVKIDAEDAEGLIVRAMADFLSHHTPTIIIELLATGGHREVTAVLDELGYDYFHLTSQGPVGVTTPLPMAGDPDMNYLCLPRA